MATPPFQVKALYDYTSVEADDLNFPSGQNITVTDVEDDDWYFGEYVDASANKKEGLFPKNFVKISEPETPPRPSRTSKSKKELEPLGTSKVAGADEARQSFGEQDSEILSPPIAAESSPNEQRRPQEDEERPPKQTPTSTKPARAQTQQPPTTVTKQPPSAATKPLPPPTSETSAPGSFRDRINAFNKPAAAPVAPVKPSGLGSSSGSGFVKKPFVAPPPSKTAYVPPPRELPPQKSYKKDIESDTQVQTADVQHEERPVHPEAVQPEEAGEDQPKPTSLKDRIALLQKQQMEQAARHTEAVQRKEKQKRQAKKDVDPEEPTVDPISEFEDRSLQKVDSGDITSEQFMDLGRSDGPPITRSNTRPRKSREATPVGSPVAAPSKDLLSDPNDADQSGVGETEEGEEFSTGRDDSDEKPKRTPSFPLPKPSQPPIREADVGDEEDNADEDVGEEDDDEAVDPEVRRRMEIRERMAKMSGGMGMAGMFGPPGGLPPRSSTKQAPTPSDRKASGNSASRQLDSSASRAPPVPIMPMPGLQKVRSPERSEEQLEVGKETEDVPKSVIQQRDAEETPDIEDIQEEPVPPPRRSTERSAAPPMPQDRPVPTPPSQSRASPPPLHLERPAPAPPIESRSVPRPASNQLLSLSEGSESDDEMSLHTRSSLRLPPGNDSLPSSQANPLQVPSTGPPPPFQSRPAAPFTRPSEIGQNSEIQPMEPSPTSPTAPNASGNRSNRVPPIPGSNIAMSSAPQNRAPPPPPPSSEPPSRVPTGERKVPPLPSILSQGRNQESDEEVTEYEGDYDTDIASGASHKDALKSHARVPSLEGDSTVDEAPLHHAGLPPLGLSSSGAPRAVPPPPPSQPPKISRRSSDMPRAAPPPPPPPRKEQSYDQGDEEYDPFNYSRSRHRPPPEIHPDIEGSVTPGLEDPNPMMSLSPPQRAVPSTTQNQPQYATSPTMSVPSASSAGTRQSADVQRTSATIRRSTDGPRPSSEQGFIAGDVDLGHGTHWWSRPDGIPPIFQNCGDLIFEVEQTSTARRGGKQAITKTVYVLFMDYSQTVVTAHFETRDPTNATLEQTHEAPPQNLRQDQLEAAHSQFGSRIAEAAASKEGSVVGDGSPFALVLDLLSSFPEALLPVGVRAYGALVYTNLANASIRQFDEIRPGDIVTFRNTKFQGHRGAMHSKYSNEVGKPDHVGVLIEWDGTKKKLRVWEQGRESKKIKSESFKLGDMRSGEVKVWRVMSRSWVGWEGQN